MQNANFLSAELPELSEDLCDGHGLDAAGEKLVQLVGAGRHTENGFSSGRSL